MPQLLKKIINRIKYREEELKNLPRIVYFHVPKCAGTSINKGIWDSIYKGKGVSKFTLNLGASQLVEKASEVDMMHVRELVLAYQLGLNSNYFCAGHFYGRPWLINAYQEKWNFVTILRNPVDRWISEFVYNKHKESSWFKNNMSLEEYIFSPRSRHIGISFLRYFSSMPSNFQGENTIQFEEEAIENLRQFKLVGTLENLNNWKTQFQETFGYKLEIPQQNLSPKSAAKQEIYRNPEILNHIQKVCAPDIRIYEEITHNK